MEIDFTATATNAGVYARTTKMHLPFGLSATYDNDS
jgi:hypothetical protein